MTRLLVVVLLAACSKSSSEAPPPAPEQAAAERKAAEDIAATVDEVLTQPPEQLTESQKQGRVDPAPIVGSWELVHTASAIDGVVREPSPPIMPGSWVFDADGTYHTRGGNELDGTYVFTGKGLMVSALGPVLDYRVDKLTATELVVTLTIGEGMWNTTTLRKAK